METLELQGAKLRYHKVGNGPLLILILVRMELVISTCH